MESQHSGSSNGKYVRIWDDRTTVFDRHTTEADKSEAFGVTEFVLPVPEGYTDENNARMIFSNGKPAAIGEKEATFAFQFLATRREGLVVQDRKRPFWTRRTVGKV